MKAPPRTAIILLCAAIWILWAFGYETVWARFTTQVRGVIVGGRDVPYKGAPRYGTEYVVRDVNGHESFYVAGATDASLQRSMPVGVNIDKEWGRLDYDVNGKLVGFLIYFYSAILGIAVLCLFCPAWMWRFATNRGKSAA
jgi:hypothetical protein